MRAPARCYLRLNESALSPRRDGFAFYLTWEARRKISRPNRPGVNNIPEADAWKLGRERTSQANPLWITRIREMRASPVTSSNHNRLFQSITHTH